MDKRTAYAALYNALAYRQDIGVVVSPCTTDTTEWDTATVKSKIGMCRGCPIWQQCRAAADTDPTNTWGVWGGQTYPRTAKNRPSNKLRDDQ